MSTQNIISIIVPVYNNEKFLEEALASIQEQDLESVEVVIINDGSTDQSSKIIEAFKDSKQSIKTLHTKNMGVSEARNLGIGASSGEFICFMDGDDRMHSGAIAEFKRIISQRSPDIIIGGATQFSDTSATSSLRRQTRNTEVLNISDFDEVSRDYVHGNYDHANWNKCFRTSIVKANDVKFISGLPKSEDMIFNWHFWSHARTVQFTEHHIIHYRIHGASATRTHDSTATFLSCLSAIHKTQDIFDSKTFLHAVQYMQRKLWFEIFDEFTFSNHTPQSFLKKCHSDLPALFTTRAEYPSINRRNFIVDKIPGLLTVLAAILWLHHKLKETSDP